MKYNKQEIESAIHANRGASANEQVELVECQSTMTVEEAMNVLAELGVPTSRTRAQPELDLSRIIGDERIIAQATKMGADPERAREVRHWAYFKASKAARKFAQSVANAGYSRGLGVAVEPSLSGRRFRVRFTHEGCLQLNSTAGHSVRLRRLASDLTGSYDGWEVTLSREELNEARSAAILSH